MVPEREKQRAIESVQKKSKRKGKLEILCQFLEGDTTHSKLKQHGLGGSFLAMAQESSMFRVHQTIRRVLCCKCGIPIVPNVANMCVKCLSSEVDITEGLQRQATLLHCPECDRYLQPPKAWIQTQLELIQLLTLCLMMLKNLNKVRLIHVEFIWTEPHSKRIRSS